MANKIYTAFISSAFESLRNERNAVIDCLLDYRILPIEMEHFTVSTDGEFSDIEELIDDSDFFIMLMGAGYGSCDENGISWTEREYLYARQKNKPVIVIICEELARLMKAEPEALEGDQKKQVDFARSLSFARAVSQEIGIKTIVSQFFNTYNRAKCRGWERVSGVEIDDRDLIRWQEENKVFDLGGVWYHVHLNDKDLAYIRVGTVKIEQDFTPENYLNLHIEGINYDVICYDAEKQVLKENKMKSSRFVGEYQMRENGEIFGIFNSVRGFEGTFDSIDVLRGARRGIHDFVFDVFAETTERIEGEFHDEAPSPKMGRIFLFKDINERNEFLLDNREAIITQK